MNKEFAHPPLWNDIYDDKQYPVVPHSRPLPLTIEEVAARWHGCAMWWGGGWSLPAMLRRREQEELILLASDPEMPEGDILEIGCGWGGSTLLLAMANGLRNKNEKVFSVDSFVGEDADVRVALTRRSLRYILDEAMLIVADSKNLLSIWPENMRRFRLVFIDGCHEPQVVMNDFINASKLTVPDGIIALHDSGMTPQHPWRECKEGQLPNFECIEPLVNTLGRIRVLS